MEPINKEEYYERLMQEELVNVKKQLDFPNPRKAFVIKSIVDMFYYIGVILLLALLYNHHTLTVCLVAVGVAVVYMLFNVILYLKLFENMPGELYDDLKSIRLLKLKLKLQAELFDKNLKEIGQHEAFRIANSRQYHSFQPKAAIKRTKHGNAS